jgi:hypothetical protein
MLNCKARRKRVKCTVHCSPLANFPHLEWRAQKCVNRLYLELKGINGTQQKYLVLPPRFIKIIVELHTRCLKQRSKLFHLIKSKLDRILTRNCRPRWLRALRRWSAAARVLGLRVRIPPQAGTYVSWECCMLSGRGLCVGLINRPEETYRMWCVWVWSWSLDNEEGLAY